MWKQANIFLAVIGLSLVSTARAELVFEQTAIELHPAIGDEKAIGHFKYQNKGDKPVAIKNVSTSCGCTAASAKQTAEPGEKSEVTATFNIGDRMGTQQKIITVTTDDPAHPTTQLHLTVFIPQLLDLKQALISWQANEPPNPKKIIAQAKDPSVKNIDVTSSNPDFTVKVEPGSAAGEYAISVQPKQTDKAIGSTLTIKPVLNNGVVKNFYATARVMPPLTPPAQAGAPAASTAGSPDEMSVALNKLDACSLLTSEDIESIEGEPPKMSKRSSNASDGLINSQCYFGLPTAGNSISLVITQRAETADAHDPKQLWNETFHHDQKEEKKRGEVKRAGQEEAPSAKKIDGLGEEAFWQGNRFGGTLYVLKGGNIVRISVGGAGDEAAKIEKSKKLAQIVLKRL
ncbi:MAG TPA: DUF1573 domain-containing protein [Chthoniobacterales bacterium]|nr:DUF1573 domain-containing protein [Chthoniobacterales bacterium]